MRHKTGLNDRSHACMHAAFGLLFLLPRVGTEVILPPLDGASSYGKPHVPKIRSCGGQNLKKVLLRRPYTTTSAVDLPTAAAASTSASSSTDNLSSTITATAGSGSSITGSSLLLPSKRFVSRFLESDRRPRGTAPNKTTSETNLEAAAVIPGFSDASSNSSSYFSRLVSVLVQKGS